MNLKLMFALIAGAAMGIGGIELSRALEEPPGYLIVEYEITEPSGWKEYLAGSKSISGNRTFLARHARGISLAGEPPKWIGIIKYASVSEALAHDSSAEYTALKPVRDRSTNWRAYVVEGLPAAK